MPIVNEVFNKYPNNWFVESGTHIGEGIQRALNAGFKNIISVELGLNYYNFSVNRFKSKSNVHIYLGDTEDLLEGLISPINEPITFWLDGHNSGYDISLG